MSAKKDSQELYRVVSASTDSLKGEFGLEGSLSGGKPDCVRQEYPVDRSRTLSSLLPDTAAREAEVVAARRRFPAGLQQPEGSFRFSMDALLLAQFGLECLARTPGDGRAPRFADLGAGCGVVGLALLLWSEASLQGVGVERERCLAEAARCNARRLGVETRYTVLCHDVAAISRLAGMPRSMRLVLANPPWLLHQRCRESPSPLRRAALVGDEKTFPCFMEAAAALLEEGGRLALVTAVERRNDALTALRGAGLFPYRLCLIETQTGVPARRLLLEGGLRPGSWHEETRCVRERHF